MDDTGEGITVFQFVPAKSLGKQSLDTGNTRGSSGQKDCIHLGWQQPGPCDHVIDALRNLLEVFRIYRLKLTLVNILADVQVALCKRIRE